MLEGLNVLLVRGGPRHIRSNHGPEFTARTVQERLERIDGQTLFIELGSPWENGYIESFNLRLRDELLNRAIFETPLAAKVLIERWRSECNSRKPHCALGYHPCGLVNASVALGSAPLHSLIGRFRLRERLPMRHRRFPDGTMTDVNSAPPPRRRLAMAFVLVAAVGLAWWLLRSPHRHNVLLITLDTTRADRIGCFGYQGALTPTIDALAARGVQFDRAYVPAPLTAPSHTSMMTGLQPPEHGVLVNGQNVLRRGIPTLAERMKSVRMATAAFVASYVLNSKFGLNRGFDLYDDDVLVTRPHPDELERYRDGSIVVDAARRWLDKQRSTGIPYFCWIHLYDPHEPYLEHRADFGNQFDDRLYDGEIAYVDRLIGRLLESVDPSDTLIIVAGDHGESLGEHGELEHGYMLYDATLRVPLVMAAPDGRSAGHRVATPVSVVDLCPTIAESVHAEPIPGISGRSLLSVLDGAALEDRPIYSQTDAPYREALWSPLLSVTTGQWRYIRTTRPELYDLTADPGELKNLVDVHADIVQELDGELTLLQQNMSLRTADTAQLAPSEVRALESLGYTGTAAPQGRDAADVERPDIKDMIVHFNRNQAAMVLLNSGHAAEAEPEFAAIVQAVPSYYRAHLNLAVSRIQQHKYAETLAPLEAALAIDPDGHRVHDMLGFVLLHLDRLDEAAVHFARLVQLRPDLDVGHMYLGEIAQRRGNFAEARREYEAALRINPRNDIVRSALNQLQGL